MLDDFEEEDSIDITPLIDCVFMLLVFFIMTTTFSKPVLDIILPKSEMAARLSERPREIVVSVREDGRLYHNQEEVAKEELVALQRSILSTAQAYVYPGGTLVYSTCTIGRAENEENVRWFLEHFPYEAVSLKGCLPEELTEKLTEGRTLPESFAGEAPEKTLEQGYLQLLPGVYPCDGFFIARFRKKMDSKSL